MSLAADRSLGQIGDRSRGTASGRSRERLAAALQVCSGERRPAAAGGGAVWSSASICECPGLSLLRHRALGVQPHRVDRPSTAAQLVHAVGSTTVPLAQVARGVETGVESAVDVLVQPAQPLTSRFRSTLRSHHDYHEPAG